MRKSGSGQLPAALSLVSTYRRKSLTTVLCIMLFVRHTHPAREKREREGVGREKKRGERKKNPKLRTNRKKVEWKT